MEGACADRILEGMVSPHIIDVLAAVHEYQPDDRALVLGCEALERELYRVLVNNDVRFLIFVQVSDVTENGFLVLHSRVAETPLHVFRAHFAPVVMELNALSEIHGNLRQVGFYVIRLCQMRVE